MKQTAVDWLENELDFLSNYIDKMARFNLFKQAKEMEKEQMVDFAFKYGDLTTREIESYFDKEYKTN
jgi:hypothetical protein